MGRDRIRNPSARSCAFVWGLSGPFQFPDQNPRSNEPFPAKVVFALVVLGNRGQVIGNTVLRVPDQPLGHELLLENLDVGQRLLWIGGDLIEDFLLGLHFPLLV